MEFTIEELKLLEKSLGHYEQKGLPEVMFIELQLTAMVTINQTESERDKTIAQLHEKMTFEKEQITLLRAKLIRLKDKAFIEEL